LADDDPKSSDIQNFWIPFFASESDSDPEQLELIEYPEVSKKKYPHLHDSFARG
jgi:hypothetical protein